MLALNPRSISADQNRVCAVGAGVLRHFQIDPPLMISDVDASVSNMGACWAEGCEGRIENVLARRREGVLAESQSEFVCLNEGGALVADYGHQGSYGHQGVLDLALSDIPRGISTYIDIGHGVGLGGLPDLTLTDAALTMPGDLVRSGQEWSAARVLRHVTGPILVDYGADGDIRVWRLTSGFLPHEGVVTLEASMPGGSFVVLPPEGENTAPNAYFDDYADGGDYVSISALLPDDQTVKVPRTGEPLIVASIARSRFLIVFSDGTAYDVDLGSEVVPSEIDLPLSGEIRTATYRNGMLAVASEDFALVFSVDMDQALWTPVLVTDSYGAPVCEVDVSSNRSTLGIVLCPEGRPGEVLSIQIETGDVILERAVLPYSSPYSVSVTDDGRTIVVGFVLGAIGVRVENEWVEPPSLSLGKQDHNDFRAGWARIDPSGEFMVTRRDGDGVELWRIGSPSDEPLAPLTKEDPWQPPDRVVFEDGVVSISWANSSGRYRRESWSLSTDGLEDASCRPIWWPGWQC